MEVEGRKGKEKKRKYKKKKKKETDGREGRMTRDILCPLDYECYWKTSAVHVQMPILSRKDHMQPPQWQSLYSHFPRVMQ
jgi:hypothetical protein